MKRLHRSTRIFILSMLVVSVFVPIFFLSGQLQCCNSGFQFLKLFCNSYHLSVRFYFIIVTVSISFLLIRFGFAATRGFIEDLSTIKFRTDSLKLNAVGEEEGEGIRIPALVVYKDVKVDPVVVSDSSDEDIRFEDSEGSRVPSLEVDRDGKVDPVGVLSSLSENIKLGQSKRNADGDYLPERNETNPDANGDNHQRQPEEVLSTSGREEDFNQTTVGHDRGAQSQSRRVLDEKLKEMKDQLIRARAYLNFAAPDNNSHLMKELRIRIKELERAMGEATKDSDLSKRALQRMRGMDATLLKAMHIYGDCSTMTKKLRAMTNNAEEQVRTHKNEATFLVKLAGRTTPKGLHCLSMRLTTEYFALRPEERELPRHQQLHDPDLYHIVVFSDNVLACAAVVDSTIFTAVEAEKIVIHVVTDSLNFAAISMWFLLNPPGKATLQILSMDHFDWLSSKYEAAITQGHDSLDSRYTSMLNHLRFYLPDIFPALDKIVLLDHDVIVQRDLTSLWNVDLKGKVNGAVETRQRNEPSFRRMDMLINFSDPMVARRFNIKARTWAFGVNLFDLKEWRRRNLTGVYLKYLQMGNKRPLWKAGSLPIGLVTFYKQTMALNRKWHVYGLGYYPGVREEDIKQAAVLHYDGVMKPWLDIGLEKYKKYWTKHVKFDHPYLQQCNIHE